MVAVHLPRINDTDVTVHPILRIATLVCLSSIAASAFSQTEADMVGTTEVSFSPISSAGVLQGCSYNFQSIVQDHVYKRGDLTAVTGSITAWVKKPLIRIGLKVGLGNIDGAGKLQFASPINAFVKSKNGNSSGSPKTQADSDTPGFTWYTIAVDEQSVGIIADLMDGAPFQVGFNRRKGGMDVYATIDPEVASSVNTATGVRRTRSSEAQVGFSECMGELMKKAKQ